MSASLRRARISLMNKVAAVSAVGASSEVESLHSEDIDADDIAPDDSVSCIDCDDDAWLALVDIDDIRPEDSISNVCARDPDNRACDAGEHAIVSKKSDTNGVDKSNVPQSNDNPRAHDEASMDTWKRSSRRHVSLPARIGHPDREQHVLDGDGHKAGFKDLKSSCDASLNVDDACPEEATRDADLGAHDESSDKRDLALNSNRNCEKDVPLRCIKWNLGVDRNEHVDASVHLQSQPLSSVWVAGEAARADLPQKIGAKLDARARAEEVSFGISTTASECDQDPEMDDDQCFPVASPGM
eukprot:TRINITY_DN5153_c0_g1_i2.p1 TRINITY_DN5153_c0_g1~~TRINITY_DN5153_c0_g1_i2.p1  ORF type:complete len:299 (-),score=61.40 TRINITY_DN5153_c0_g1_i2:135-1031(-)